MRDRRDFLRTLGSAAGGVLLMDRGARAAGQMQAARREVVLNGRRITTVDVHAHCVFPEIADLITGTPLDGVGFAAWQALGPARLEEMDSRGVDYQVLSVNRYWWYAAERELAKRIVQTHDEKLAAWCRQHPKRFVALSSVALQHPDLAAEQLEHAVKRLGARGASIGGHVAGEVPSSERFDPFPARLPGRNTERSDPSGPEMRFSRRRCSEDCSGDRPWAVEGSSTESSGPGAPDTQGPFARIRNLRGRGPRGCTPEGGSTECHR